MGPGAPARPPRDAAAAAPRHRRSGPPAGRDRVLAGVLDPGRRRHAAPHGPGRAGARHRVGAGRGVAARAGARPARRAATTGPASTSRRCGCCTSCGARGPGLRLARTGLVMDALVPAVLEQKVTGVEARRRVARAAVQVRDPGARAARGPARAAAAAGAAGRPDLGLAPLRRRPQAAAGTIRAAATVARRLEECADLPHEPGERAAAAHPRHRGLDGGRDRAAGLRRPGRGERRRLPPAEHGGAGCSAVSARGTDERDARAAGAVGRAAAAGHAADRAHRQRAPRYGPKFNYTDIRAI